MASDFRIGNWIVRPERLCMHLPGKTVHITPKSMAVLQCLAEAPGQVVARNEILDKVWPGAAVTDDVLTQCIVELRKAFDDSADDPQFIETIPKRGLRLVAPVTEVAEERDARSRFRPIAVAILALVFIGIASTAYLYHDRMMPADATKSIAVLPFNDLSPDGDQGVFADGLAEELINHLTQLEGLQVTGRASSFALKERREDLQAIGDELAVNYVLDGSVRQAEGALRVTAKLTNVHSGLLEWSETYPATVEDIFSVQEQIAEAVAMKLSVGLGVASIEGGTSNIAAYEEFVAGNAAYIGLKPDPIQAILHFERATELDPNYAIAWARLAEMCHLANMDFGHIESMRLPERRENAMSTALRIAPESTTVLTTKAQLLIGQHNYREARLLLDNLHRRYEGREIPYSFAWLDLSLKMGRLHDAFRALESILRRDPLNPNIPNYLGHFYYIDGRIDDALAERERGFQSGNRTPYLANTTVWVALAANRRDEIEKWLRRSEDQTTEKSLWPQTFQAHMLEIMNDREWLLESLRKMQSAYAENDFIVIHWAAWAGDDQMALRSLQRTPDPWVLWIPQLQRIRKTEEFKQIVIDAGFVDYWREFGWGDFCRPMDGDDFECE